MTGRSLALLATLALTSACVDPLPPPASPCPADKVAHLVGQPLSALQAAMPLGGFKVDYPLPDGTVTAEFFPDRVRVSVDEAGIITSIGCG